MVSPARFGLTARGLLSTRTTGSARITLGTAKWTSPAGQQCRWKGVATHRTAHGTDMNSQRSPAVEMQRKLGKGTNLAAEITSMVLPGTFVLPPLSQFPKPFSQKVKLLWYWLLIKGQEILTNAAVKYTSKPSFFKRAIYKPKRSVLIPTAKAMHRAMAEALASGDRDTINKICSRSLGTSLLASIDTRPKTRRYGWQLLDYTKKLFYPSVKSHRITALGREKNAPIVRQAVVSISSRQRRVQYDAQGKVIPGSEKEIDVVEHVAMACVVDPRTWAESEWRLVGTISATTLEEWDAEKEILKELMKNPSP